MDRLPQETPADIGDFFGVYFNYIGRTEAPKIYNRWSAISMVNTLLCRQLSLPFGHSVIYPNMYIFLVGSPGARKGTALGPIKNILTTLRYNKISPQRLSPEKFLSELQRINLPRNLELLTDLDIEELNPDAPCEMFVIADEVADFLRGNTDFIKVLTNLWDNLSHYDHPKLHGKSVHVNEPTINIIGGITPEDITINIPPETIGQGFFSRLILVYSEPSLERITLPKPPSGEAVSALTKKLDDIRKYAKGTLVIRPEAEEFLEEIYAKFSGVKAVNFRHYNSRRFSHLLKLCICLAAMDCMIELTAEHVMKANTLLCATEHRMPKALGEFGRSRNAAVIHNITEILKNAGGPLTPKEIWRYVCNDLNRTQELALLLQGMEYAEKIKRFTLAGKTGFMLNRTAEVPWQKGLVYDSPGFLFPEEMP